MYSDFIKENVAIKGAKRIGIYDENGNRVGQIPLGALTIPKGKKMYSFAVMADTHIGQTQEANERYMKTIEWIAGNEDIAFVCHCGDIVNDGLDTAHWGLYKEGVNALGEKPIYSIAGNHDRLSLVGDILQEQTGHNVYYSFEHGGDVFIMLGVHFYNNGNATQAMCQFYPRADLKAIHQIFEANRDKRCFIMHHVPPSAGLADFNIEAVQNYYIPLSFFQHYENSIVFHGHVGVDFAGQARNDEANFSKSLGFQSVHIPPLYNYGEFYIADVYKNGIHLQGFDIDTKTYSSIASYWIPTETKTIDAGTYTAWQG